MGLTSDEDLDEFGLFADLGKRTYDYETIIISLYNQCF